MGTFRETLAKGTEGALHLGPERPRVYSDLSPEDKEMYNADIRATNILLQGLPKDICSLINHYTNAKDIWDNSAQRISIHDYYVRFAKIINDMRNIKMTMSRMQLNSKFVNNMLPEWGRFVTLVKLNRGLRDSNYDQLYAYLKQHEAHANENKMITSSNLRNQATVQDGRVVVQKVKQGRLSATTAMENGVALDEEQLLFLVGGQDNAVDEDVDEQPVQDLVLNVDNVFQADDCDAFDIDVEKAPTAQTMFMANLSSADPVYDKAGPSYDSDILFEALTKEVKEMKKKFEELEAEVDQHVVDRKHDEIEQKNLLIANDNLIVDCLFKDVFHVATNFELNVSSFTEMHHAHTSLKARCLELEVELSNLGDKIQKDNHDELIKRFSNLEVNHLNLQLKYQNLKESFGNNTSPPTQDVPDFDSVFVIEKIKALIQGKDNVIKKWRMQISQLNETCSEADHTLDFRTLDFQITQLTKKSMFFKNKMSFWGKKWKD
ncbi:hypothetical protein Tco_1038003 [Tanacetum coccineum]